MNRVHKVVWNQSKRVWQAVSELGRSTRGLSSGSAGAIGGALRGVVGRIAAGTLFLMALPLQAAELPSGGTVAGGQGAISGSGNTLTIQQSSQNMAINWQDFSIAEGHTVNFVQPNAQAAVLNRVTGNNVSDIRGALNANGRVFLVNPNGVMFSSTAQVDVGSLVASTLDISTEDFMAGNYQFEGASANAIINQGNITAGEGGVVAMIAAKIINTGSITTPQGSTLMGAGSKVTLDLGGPVKIEVEEALLDTYIEQGGAIRADGGLVYLTAKAAGNLASSVINHTGVTEAHTLAAGADGRIMLMGDMDSGQVQVSGMLDASAPISGDGGFIETSAARVEIAPDVMVTTAASAGNTGEWLIDPVDITIAASGGNVTGATIANALQSTDVTLDTTGSGSCTGVTCSTAGTAGDIFVNDSIRVTGGDTDTTLTLKAYKSIIVDAGVEISSTSGKLDTVFWARAGGDQNANDTQIGSVWLQSGASVLTNGGNIIIGGGADPLTGYARGVATFSSGAYFGENNALTRGAAINGTLDAGGGDISIHGRGRVPGASSRGVSVGGDIRTDGTGTVSIRGYATGGSDAIAIGDSALTDKNGSISAGTGTVYLMGQRDSGKSINLNGGSSITSSGKVVLDGLSGEIDSGSGDFITADELLILSASRVTLGSAQNDIATLAASGISSGGLSVTDKDDLIIGSVEWHSTSYAGVETTGTISIATLSGNLSVNQNISTSSTVSDAITLNAGRDESAGTASGGDIHISDASVTTGTEGGARLYTGSIAGSSGLTAVIGSGSGRFRYNSDESADGYTAALSDGLYAIYREQPTILVSAEDEHISYGTSLPSYTAIYSGFANGDTDASLGGSVNWSTASGTTSTSGHRVVGSYDVSYAGGLTNALGFRIANNTSSTGELVVEKRVITLSGITAENRVYDGTTDATVDTTGASGWIAGDDVQVSAIGAFSDKHAEADKVVALSSDYAGGDVGNYTITGQATTSASISPRDLTVIADDQSKNVGAVDPALTYVTDCGAFNDPCGLVEGDVLSGALSRASGEAIGRYSIELGTLANSDYAIAFVPGTFDIISTGNPGTGNPGSETPNARNPALDASIQSVQQTFASPTNATGTSLAMGTGSTMNNVDSSLGGSATGLEVVDVDSDSEQAIVGGRESQAGGPLRMFVIDGGLNLGDK